MSHADMRRRIVALERELRDVRFALQVMATMAELWARVAQQQHDAAQE